MSSDEKPNKSTEDFSGSDVKKLKKLLADGFQITRKSYSMTRKDGLPEGQMEMSITVSLKKGTEEKQIVSTNDPEFFPFLNHFVFMVDEHDNSVAVYVDNPSEIEPTDPNKIPLPKDNQHIIYIGSRKFEDGVSIHYVVRDPKKPLEMAVGFRIWKDKNLHLNDVDYKDEVKIIEKQTQKTIFVGFINGAINSSGQITFRCLSGEKNSRYQKLTLESKITNGLELLYFISKTGGMKIKFKEDILKKINLTSREFYIIMPLDNLILREDIIIGDVTIYHIFDSDEDYLIRRSNIGSTDQDWNGNKLRIRTTVVATDFFDAVFKGFKKISRIVDWMTLRSDFSFPSYKIDGNEREIYFSMYRHMSRIKTPLKIFCKEKDSTSHLLFDLNSILETKLIFDHEATDFFDATKDLMEPILAKSEENLSDTERSLLSSAHWLRLGIFSQNLTERLMFLYNSLEFAIADVCVGKQFTKEELKKIRDNINTSSWNEKQKSKIEWAWGELNRASLNEALNTFCSAENIPMTQEEWKMIQTCREKRNDVIHGKKDIEVNSEETDKLQTLIERILLKRLDKI